MTRKKRKYQRRGDGRPRSDGKPARTEAEREQQLVVIADLRLQGWPQYKIAAHLGLHQSTISMDLAEVHRRWEAESIKKIDQYKSMELARIDKILVESWEAWENSKRPRKEVTVERRQRPPGEGQDGEAAEPVEETKRSLKHIDQIGDPRYLREIIRCIQERCKLLGLYADKSTFTEEVNKMIAQIVIRGPEPPKQIEQGEEQQPAKITGPKVVINKENAH